MDLPGLLAAVLLAAVVSSCATSSEYSDSYPLTGVTFRIRNGGIAGSIPEGWTASSPGAEDDTTVALTLAEGDSLRIVFRPVTVDILAKEYFSKHGVADLAMLTRTLHDSTIGNVRDGIDVFTLGEREFAAYEVTAGGRRMRVAVFATGKHYYQCEAWPLAPPASAASYDRLFSVQQSVLRSLR